MGTGEVDLPYPPPPFPPSFFFLFFHFRRFSFFLPFSFVFECCFALLSYALGFFGQYLMNLKITVCRHGSKRIGRLGYVGMVLDKRWITDGWIGLRSLLFHGATPQIDNSKRSDNDQFGCYFCFCYLMLVTYCLLLAVSAC